MKKKSRPRSKTKTKWATPKLEIISETKYENRATVSIHAQYGGGGTVVHGETGTGGDINNSRYVNCE